MAPALVCVGRTDCRRTGWSRAGYKRGYGQAKQGRVDRFPHDLFRLVVSLWAFALKYEAGIGKLAGFQKRTYPDMNYVPNSARPPLASPARHL